MYKISDEYKNYIETKTSLSPKSKIVVDGIEYLGNVIKTFPKISHKAEKMFGGFPIRTCSFEIYDLDNTLNFENKEITVFRGIVVDGKTEYIPQGIFIPTADKITTNVSQRTISFQNIQDKTQLFDSQYTSKLDWSVNHTGLEIVQEICDNLNIELETTTFNFSDYSFKQPNFVESISNREVISRLAEIGGSIAFINREGKLAIRSQNKTDHVIERKRYGKLSREKQYGIINTVVLGNDGMDNDIVYPDPNLENKIEWKILDNPFVDLYREEMIEEVSKYIIGKSIIPFQLSDFVDGNYLDLNDTITIIDRNDEQFEGIILNYENNSRLKSNIGADTQESSITNYKLAGSNQQELNNVKLQVDHVNKRIDSVVENVSAQDKKISEAVQTVEGFDRTIKSIESTASDASKKATEASNKVDNLQIGGTNLASNLPRNWENGSISESKAEGSSYSDLKTTSTSRIRIIDLIPLTGDKFVISFNSGYRCCFALFDSQQKYLGYTNGFTNWFTTSPSAFNKNASYIALVFSRSDNGNMSADDIEKIKVKLEKGNSATDWSPSPEDTYTEMETQIKETADGILESVKKVETEQRITSFKVDLAQPNVIVQTDMTNRPLESRTYDIGYQVEFLGSPVECIPTTKDPHSGITLATDAKGIHVKVDADTSISLIDNKFNLEFEYTVDEETYKASKTFIVSLMTYKTETVQSEEEPTDKSVLWFDINENTLKRYNGESWEVIGDYSFDISTLTESISSLSSEAKEMISNLQEYVENIRTELSATMEHTSEAFQFNFSEITKNLSDLDDKLTESDAELKKYIRFEDGHIVLGEVGNEYVLEIRNDRVQITYNNSIHTQMVGDKLITGAVYFVNKKDNSGYGWRPEDNGSISFEYLESVV